jgi:hypothetical protein
MAQKFCAVNGTTAGTSVISHKFPPRYNDLNEAQEQPG